MSDEESWAAPGSKDAAPASPPPPPAAAPPAPPARPQPQYGQYAPPPPPQAAQPQYGQYAPPPPAQPQHGQYPPPAQPPAQPQYGHYAPPPPPQYGQYVPQPQPQYGQPPLPPGVPAYAQGGYAQPGPTGWAPPPKPGLIPLRPLGFGTLLGAPFQVLRRNPKATFGSGLIVQLVIVVVTVLFVGAAVFWAASRAASVAPADADAVGAGNVAIVLFSVLIPLVLSLFASALLQAVLVVEVARGTLGEKRRLGELWKAAFKRILPLTGWFALAGLAVAVVIGVLVLIVVLLVSGGGGLIAVGVVLGVLFALGSAVLFVWLGTKTALVPSIIVLERLGVFASIRRSWALTNGSFWRTFGAIALVYGILSIASQIISTPFSFLAPIAVTLIDPNGSGSGIVALIVLYLVFVAFTIVLSAITSVIQGSTIAVIYIDLRMRKEGLDIELTRFVEAREDGLDSWADPYLPTGRG